jgi:glyoxylase I family protein
MTASATSSKLPATKAAAAIPIHGLHHFAYRCRDAEETRHFYEDILGMPLWHVIQSERVPSTGEYCPHTQLFFRMADGSCIAFFDLGDDVAAQPSPNTPAWVNHLALRVDTVEHLEKLMARLQAHGVQVLGVTDHHIFKSVCCFDPNGLRLELTAQLASEMQMLQASEAAHARLAEWTRRKDAWRRERAVGRTPAASKTQQNGRAEVAARGGEGG